MRLFHIARRADWEAARSQGSYRVSTLGKPLEAEGFIHASLASQVAATAWRFYRSEPELVVLELDSERLGCEVRFETPPGSSEAFPHIFGPVPIEAVVAVHAWPRTPEGGLVVPERAV